MHDIKAEWQDDHTLVDSQDAYFQRLAMLSDILVVCGAIRNDPYYEHSLAHFLLSSARPVLVVPPTAKITPLEESDIVLGWEPSASTIRAITMTMPFLRRARKVYLLPFGDLQGPVCSQDIQLFLSNHNVNVDLLAPLSSEGLAETVFLHTAETVKPAMIILGGHIHSRLRDLVLGSSTEYMLNNCRAPLCLVH